MKKGGAVLKKFLPLGFIFTFCILHFEFASATPSTHIWAPSTDVQPYKKVHLTADTYTPTTAKGTNSDNYDQHLYVQ